LPFKNAGTVMRGMAEYPILMAVPFRWFPQMIKKREGRLTGRKGAPPRRARRIFALEDGVLLFTKISKWVRSERFFLRFLTWRLVFGIFHGSKRLTILDSDTPP
jgi:hypothetical protein